MSIAVLNGPRRSGRLRAQTGRHRRRDTGRAAFLLPGNIQAQAACDPGPRKTTLGDLTGGSAVFYDTQVKVSRV